MIEVAKKQRISYSHFEMTQAIFDRLVSHPLTLTQYRIFAGYSADAPVANIGSDIVWESVRKNLGLPYVVIVDEMSMIEVDGIPTVSSSSFAPTNVILRGSNSSMPSSKLSSPFIFFAGCNSDSSNVPSARLLGGVSITGLIILLI